MGANIRVLRQRNGWTQAELGALIGWFEYLDQIWDATETADRTSLTVLPALMICARKETARQHRVPRLRER